MRTTTVTFLVSMIVAGGLFVRTPTSARVQASVERNAPERAFVLSGNPSCMTIDRHDHIYLASGDIFKLTTGGKLLAHWIQPSNANCVAVAPDNSVYVTVGTGTGDDQVRKLSPAGKVLAIWGENVLREPWGIAIDARGRIAVSDAGHNRIVLFSKAGKVVATWNSVGTPRSKLNDPLDLAEDSTGNLIVAEAGKARVLRISPAGKLIDAWSGTDLFAFPTGVAVDRAGMIYVTDSITMRVTKLSSRGQVLATWGGLGTKPTQFLQPEGITVDSRRNIYVAESGGRRIQVLSPSGAVLGTWG